MPSPRTRLSASALLLAACAALACAALGCSKALRGYAAADAPEVQTPPLESRYWTEGAWGAYLVLFGDFGSLTTDNLATNALPWKLVSALPDVVPEPFYGDPHFGWQPVDGQPLRRFGVIYRASLAGPPSMSGLALRAGSRWTALPVGYARATVQRTSPDVSVDMASENCSMCHLGRLWDAGGWPTDRVWWGVPNHSIDLDALRGAVSRALLDPRATDDAILAAIQSRFPGTVEAELTTYRKRLLPALKRALAAADARWHNPHPWIFGGPGSAHGVALLREALADEKTRLSPAYFPAAYVKVPNLYAVAQKTWLLADASLDSAHAADGRARLVAHLTGFLPMLGTLPERAIEQVPRLEKVAAFLEELTPPPFPGILDRAAAARGAPEYARRCAGCHGDRAKDGTYSYPSRKVPVAEIGTDPGRAQAIDADLSRRFGATEVGKLEKLERSDSYVAPSLQGVWANAPYLHNGSVPTLWHLLAPEQRPARFLTGGHAFDTQWVGIACVMDKSGACVSPPGYAPWSEPRMFDTSEPGRSNRGHEAPAAGLTDATRTELVEYLKTL